MCLQVVVLGYLRPEVRFSGVDALVRRIRTDVGLASSQLADPELAEHSEDDFLRGPF